MLIDRELAAFLTSPVMIIVGTSDQHGKPEIGRGVGAKVDAAAGAVELVLSAWQWPGTVENLRANGRVAVTFARPSDYVSYQVKGRATVRSVQAGDIVLSEGYMAGIVAALGDLGLAPGLAAPWLTNREAVVARILLAEIYVQTPGPQAGTALGTRS